MTSYYKGNNIGLNYDAANATWSFINEPNDFIDPDSFSTADPAFDYTPPPSTDDDQDQDDDFNPCPVGYIYDNTLKQCVPDPNYQAAGYQQDTGGGPDQPQATRVEFDASTPEGRKAMYEHGLEHGYFTMDTSKGGAYEFLGPKKTGLSGTVLESIGQYGEDREYQRYINELAKEDAKRKAAGQLPILAQAIGFFGLSKSFVGEQKPVFGDITTDYNKKIQAFNTASMNKVAPIKIEDTGDASIAERIAAEERARKERFAADIKQEQLKREMQKTIAEAEEREKIKKEKGIETEKDKRDMQETIRKAEKAQQVKEEYRDTGQVTYKPKETGGYVTTPNRPSAPPGERGGGGYTKPTSYERPGIKGAPGYHW